MQLRKRAGISQVRVGKELGVRQATVSGWETGYSVPHLTPSQTLRLMQLFNCSLEDLIAEFEPDKLKKSCADQLTERHNQLTLV